MSNWLHAEFRAQAAAVRFSDIADDLGVTRRTLAALFGGVGVSAASFRSRPGEGRFQDLIWEPSDAPSDMCRRNTSEQFIVIPEWRGILHPQNQRLQKTLPELVDTVLWRPGRTPRFYRRIGAAAALGEWRIEAAISAGCPVYLYSNLPAWINALAENDRPGAPHHGAIFLDWNRGWELLGNATTLVGDTIELCEQLGRRIKPPRLDIRYGAAFDRHLDLEI